MRINGDGTETGKNNEKGKCVKTPIDLSFCHAERSEASLLLFIKGVDSSTTLRMTEQNDSEY